MRRGLEAAFAVAVLVVPSALGAQDGARLRGIVTNQDRGGPVPGAEVFLDSARVAVTDESGAFLVTGLRPGEYRLGIRALGFQPREALVHLTDTRTYQVEVPLQPGATALEALTVEAMRLPPGRVGEIFQRMKLSSGDFITRSDLETWRPFETSVALSRSRRVHLNFVKMGDCLEEALFGRGPEGNPIGDVGGGAATPASLAGVQDCPNVYTRPAVQVLMGRGIRRCVPSFYLDGVRFEMLPGIQIDDVVSPHDIELIEIYGEFEVPGEFLSAATGCGVIAIWTRTG